MAQPATVSLPALLGSLTQSLSSSLEVTPKLAEIESSKDGLSLLDVKNELLLSYLQNLVFLILLKIRNARKSPPCESHDGSVKLRDTIVKKLAELRLYLEKGVRPLEDKLRYQIEKVLRAAEDAERNERAAEDTKTTSKKGKVPDSDSDSGSSNHASEAGSDDEEDEDEDVPTAKVSELQYRPNPSAFVRPARANDDAKDKGGSKDGIYRPPKIAPVVMPTTDRHDERSDHNRLRAMKSATMDEFINDELSVAPQSQPSIGTNILGRGRHVKTAAERKAEEERRVYEETNFVRLPKESKKERAKNTVANGGKSGRMSFGGEEWRDLGEGADRINRLTKKNDGRGGGGTKALLDKSRKRTLDTVDGPRGSGSGGFEMGERYLKRLKVQELGRTSRGRKR